MEKERERERTNETRGTRERVGTPSEDTNVGDLTELGEGLRARGEEHVSGLAMGGRGASTGDLLDREGHRWCSTTSFRRKSLNHQTFWIDR